jgi:hypothetical protein
MLEAPPIPRSKPNGIDHGLRMRDRNHVRCAGNHDGCGRERGPERTGDGARCEERLQTSLASNVISALRTLETGQFFSALLAI